MHGKSEHTHRDINVTFLARIMQLIIYAVCVIELFLGIVGCGAIGQITLFLFSAQSSLQLQRSNSTTCVWLEEAMPGKAVWRFSTMENGALFAMTFGT